MMGPEFFQTIMGKQFFDGTMPRLVKAMEKMAANQEKLIALLERQNGLLEKQVEEDERWRASLASERK